MWGALGWAIPTCRAQGAPGAPARSRSAVLRVGDRLCPLWMLGDPCGCGALTPPPNTALPLSPLSTHTDAVLGVGWGLRMVPSGPPIPAPYPPFPGLGMWDVWHLAGRMGGGGSATSGGAPPRMGFSFPALPHLPPISGTESFAFGASQPRPQSRPRWRDSNPTTRPIPIPPCCPPCLRAGAGALVPPLAGAPQRNLPPPPLGDEAIGAARQRADGARHPEGHPVWVTPPLPAPRPQRHTASPNAGTLPTADVRAVMASRNAHSSEALPGTPRHPQPRGRWVLAP